MSQILRLKFQGFSLFLLFCFGFLGSGVAIAQGGERERDVRERERERGTKAVMSFSELAPLPLSGDR